MSCGNKPQNGPAIYKALIAEGASTPQAVGIMANMWFESRWDPQCWGIDTNGKPSVGLVNWNNNSTAAGLLTGHDSQDILAQVHYLATSGGFGATGGASDPGQAASNFAHNYEKCTECGYPGTSQLTSRAAYATTLYPLVVAGNWGKIIAGGGIPSSGGSGGQSATLTSDQTNCVIGWGWPSFLGQGGGHACIWYQGWSRALLGGALIGAGGLIGITGLALLIGSQALAGLTRVPVASGVINKTIAGARVIGR